MLKNEKHSNNFSKPIVVISIIGMMLGVAVMVLTLSIATGFQDEIKKKLMSFGSHIQIESMYQNNNNETTPMSILNVSADSIKNIETINSIQKFAYKTAILQSKSKNNLNQREIEGLVLKGLDNQINFGFFDLYLIEGRCPQFSAQNNDTIVLSKSSCQKLNLSINDKVSAFFISEGKPKQRNFIVGGIYHTGLEKLDNQFGFISHNKLIEINKWGTKLNLTINYSDDSSKIKLICKNKSYDGVFLYQFGKRALSTKNDFYLNSKVDTQMVIIGYEVDDIITRNLINIPDTICFDFNSKKQNFNFDNIAGSGQFYTGGYEIKLANYNNSQETISKLKVLFGPQFNITTIEQKHDEMFSWLNLIYQNVYIIIALMIAVAIINMASSLLVLIVEKTRMIGILKSLGMKNKALRKVFVIHGGFLITVGFIAGNLLALLIIGLQNSFHFLKLPQENYYLSEVPMHIPLNSVIMLNLGAFIFCYLAMVLPSYISTKISPVKAINSEI